MEAETLKQASLGDGFRNMVYIYQGSKRYREFVEGSSQILDKQTNSFLLS